MRSKQCYCLVPAVSEFRALQLAEKVFDETRSTSPDMGFDHAVRLSLETYHQLLQEKFDPCSGCIYRRGKRIDHCTMKTCEHSSAPWEFKQ